jgi:hypothetical protein
MDIRLARPSALALAAFVFALIYLAALTASPGEAQVMGKSSCGKVRAYYRDHHTRQYIEASAIKTRRLSCGNARAVAHTWARKVIRAGYNPALIHRAEGFHCHYTRIGSDVGKVSCRQGRRSLRFGEYDSSPYH